MKSLMKSVLKIFGILLVCILTIYWFELDKKAIQKFEPLFRRFASKVE